MRNGTSEPGKENYGKVRVGSRVYKFCYPVKEKTSLVGMAARKVSGRKGGDPSLRILGDWAKERLFIVKVVERCYKLGSDLLFFIETTLAAVPQIKYRWVGKLGAERCVR